MSRERVLVTGCAGFVGRVLVPFLEDEGYETWGIDRRDDLVDFAGSRYLTVDLLEASTVESVVREAKPRHVVHLAAQSSAARSFDEPRATIVNNVVAGVNLLEAVRVRAADARLLVVGSADVYGPVRKEDLPLKETLPPNPNNPYGLSKAILEGNSQMYANLFGVDVVMTRSFNHTGPGRPDTFVLSSFAKQIVGIEQGRREAVIEVGNVEVRRDFSDVRDVARAYVMLLRDGVRGQVYNVCSGTARRLRDVVERMAELAGTSVELRVNPGRLRPADIEELRGDNAKLRTATGWQPEIEFDATLTSLLDYWRRGA